MNDTAQKNTHWWGEFNLGNQQSHQWQVGPLQLVIRCINGEWQVAYERDADHPETGADWSVNDSEKDPDQFAAFSRYVFRETSGVLTITPLLADRPVITRPITPFHLTAGEETTLYVSSPIWMSIAVGSSQKKICEIGIQRPSDTWFGPSTREGELCYASSTHCHLNLEDASWRSYRAVTPVLVRNKADSTLLIERLNLPAPLLTLYIMDDGQLWTPRITLTREIDGEMAALKIDSRPPSEVETARLIGRPRKSVGDSPLMRAFNAVFSK